MTGAALRLGREISLALARQGHGLALHCNHSKDKAEQLCDEIRSLGVTAKVYQADLTDLSSLKELFESVTRDDTLEHLVNNASKYEHDTVSTISPESFERNLSINLRAPLFLSKYFFEYQKSISKTIHKEHISPGIINLLDQKVASTNADNLSYTLAKHGLHNLTEMLAKEFAPAVRGKHK